jgi:hypothetical protein
MQNKQNKKEYTRRDLYRVAMDGTPIKQQLGRSLVKARESCRNPERSFCGLSLR